MPINKTTFYIGEEVRIYGRISPTPENRNIQLVRLYYCPWDGYWYWGIDLWVTCDDLGNFEFRFPATVERASYCRIATGDSQRWQYMVRYQPRIGEPPVTFESGFYLVINQGVPPGTLRVFAVEDSNYVTAEFVIDGMGPYVTPYVLQLNPGTYTIKCTYKGQTQTQQVTVESGKTVDVWFRFTAQAVRGQGLELSSTITLTPVVFTLGLIAFNEISKRV